MEVSLGGFIDSLGGLLQELRSWPLDKFTVLLLCMLILAFLIIGTPGWNRNKPQ